MTKTSQINSENKKYCLLKDQIYNLSLFAPYFNNQLVASIDCSDNI